jgi:UDP-N-acetylmuramoyl-L-alanyl-D-glutamate--2,6-diaminopimelate ligase
VTGENPRSGARVSSEAVTPAFPPAPLEHLTATVPGAQIDGDRGVLVADVAYDSRDVAPGSLFFCVPGERTDGHDFAGNAMAAEAVALVVDRWLEIDAPQVRVGSVREAMGPMSSVAFGHPAESMIAVGVTGTNGKTTVTYLLESIFEAAGWKAGVIGTTGARIGGEPLPISRTTPEAPDLFRLLAAMRDRQVRAVALEVSSHALAQHRVDGLVVDVAVFTNLSQDHLDFHGTMEAYLEAKARLFSPSHARHAVVNVDDPAVQRLLQASMPVTTYGVDHDADLHATEVVATADGTSFIVDGVAVRSNLRGAFNAANALAAFAAARVLGLDDGAIVAGIGALDSVPGRMEAIDSGRGSLVVVDYAHTPDSIRSVLLAARRLAPGRLIVVFGCGGDRDHHKRPLMGAAATATADLTIVTTDNPRSEDPLAIITEIQPGASEGGGAFLVEPDRRAAIRLALHEATPGDVVVVAGKGHESTQELGDRTIAFDDRVVVREELAAIGRGT